MPSWTPASSKEAMRGRRQPLGLVRLGPTLLPGPDLPDGDRDPDGLAYCGNRSKAGGC